MIISTPEGYLIVFIICTNILLLLSIILLLGIYVHERIRKPQERVVKKPAVKSKHDKEITAAVKKISKKKVSSDRYRR